MYTMKIGDNLRAIRQKSGLSLRDLQKEIGISYHTLGAYERNTIQPTIENCYKVCKYFKVPIESLIIGVECVHEFSDFELKKLFAGVDKMGQEDRENVKKFLRRYVKARDEYDQVVGEIEK